MIALEIHDLVFSHHLYLVMTRLGQAKRSIAGGGTHETRDVGALPI